MDMLNIEEPKLPVSKSIYEKLNDMMNKSPAVAISSVCALFIVIVLSLTLPLYFPVKEAS